ncbi:MAG TPA: hypothetical protein VD997_16705 [Phycisphaerales bacterium]|nr:hypothetical protein [Phycisphaerales bacterium]
MSARLTRSDTRRGFAMAIVLMLLAVSGVVIAFMLDRQANQTRTVQREIESYTFHHISRGIQEAVEAWIRSNGNNPLGPALSDDGHAFDLVVERGQTVEVYFLDAQGAVLAEFAGLTGDSLDMAIDILQQLRRAENRRTAEYIRREGPVAISINVAPEPVLRAVISSVLDQIQTNALVREIMTARAAEVIDRAKLEAIFRDADTPGANIPKLTALLATEPVLWQVIAQAKSPEGVWPPPRGTIRYGGLALVSTGAAAAGRNRSADLQRSSSMISWENLSEQP